MFTGYRTPAINFDNRTTFRDDDSAPETAGDIITVITRFSVLSTLVNGLRCLECGAAYLVIRVADHRLGLVAAMETVCTECDTVFNSTLTSDRIDGSSSGNVPFVVVRQAVAASMDMGVGHAGLVNLCRFLNIYPLTQTSYRKHTHVICEANKIVVTRTLDDAASVVRHVYRDIDSSIEHEDTINLTVNYNGFWMTRGHKSQYEIGWVITEITGLAIDLHVMSLYCQRCTYASTRNGGRHTATFQEWYVTHEPKCNQNYEGTFTRLANMQVYGDVELQKEECVNHIAKHLNTALRKLASSGKKVGVTLGGHGFGRLTGKKIEILSRYYRMAVQAHPHDVNGMQHAIVASFDHCSSTDEIPQHDRCPVGARSWCFYQKTLATGQEPGPHRTNVGTPLAPDVAEHVKEVYTRLAHVDLVKRCTLGKTQNANENLRSVVWSKCPKTTFVGLERVVSATCSAVSQFNAGIKVTMKNLCEVMQVPSGAHLLASAEKADRRRLKQAKRQTLAASKEARQARFVARTQAAAATSTDYAAGEF